MDFRRDYNHRHSPNTSKGEDKHTLKCYWQIFYCLKHSFLTSLPRQKKKSIHTFSPTCCNLQHHGLTFLYNSTCMQLIQFPLSLTSIIQLTYMLSITSAKKKCIANLCLQFIRVVNSSLNTTFTHSGNPTFWKNTR